MQPLFQRLLVAGMSLLTIGIGGWRGAQIAGESAAAQVPPHVITLLQSSFDPDGTTRSFGAIVTAVRGDGSRVKIQGKVYEKNGRKVFSRQAFVYDLAQQRLVARHDLTRSTTTTPLHNDEAARLSAPSSSNCIDQAGPAPVPTSHDSAEILGYQTLAVAFEIPASGDAGSPIRVTQWRAPALGCSILREEHFVMDRAGNPRYTTVMREAVAVSLGEPPVEYFSTPPGNAERRPSELVQEYFRAIGGDCPDCMREVVERADERYLERRRAAGWE